MSGLFGSNMASYAMEMDGMIVCIDYVYSGDTVISYVETLYISLDGASEEEIAQLEAAILPQFEEYAAIPCISVNSNRGNLFYSFSVTYNDVDQAENYGALYDAGIIDENAPISITESHEAAIAEGFIQA